MLDPAGLVTNQTEKHGHFVTLRLVGTTSSRDAIGTEVSVTAGSKTWTQQLTAGDGYHASNERKLHFGVGDMPKIGAATVRWPTGETVVLSDLAVDATYLLIEGKKSPVRIHH
jgi:hypothetical protein